jgi:hypothetical protein
LVIGSIQNEASSSINLSLFSCTENYSTAMTRTIGSFPPPPSLPRAALRAKLQWQVWNFNEGKSVFGVVTTSLTLINIKKLRKLKNSRHKITRIVKSTRLLRFFKRIDF